MSVSMSVSTEDEGGREGAGCTHYEGMKPHKGHPSLELVHPGVHGDANQVDVVVPVGETISLCGQHCSQRIYHTTGGQGLVRVGRGEFKVNEGDTVCLTLQENVEQRVTNTGSEALQMICLSSHTNFSAPFVAGDARCQQD